MPTSRLGRIAAFFVFAILLVITAATNVYLARRLTGPPRTLKIRLIIDPANPQLSGIPLDQQKKIVESVSSLFQKAAGITLSVSGSIALPLPSREPDPSILRTVIDRRTPREDADLLVAFWVSVPADSRPGSALPFNSAVVVRADPSDAVHSQVLLAHQLAILFGVPISKDPHSVMHLPPTELKFDRDSTQALMETRLFDFSKGLGGASGRMRARVLHAIEREARLYPPADKETTPRVVFAELLMRDGQFSAAMDQYRTEIRSNPGNLAARLGLSQAMVRASQFQDAESEARLAMKQAPGRAEPHYQLGSVLLRSGNPEAAISEFRRAIEIQPNSPRNHAGLAVAYGAAIGQIDEANRELAAAIKINPRDPVLYADLEYINALRGRLNKQLEAAEESLRLHPESGVAHGRVALLLIRLGQVDRGLAEAREAIKLGPNTWQIQYTLAVALYAAHDYSASSAALAEAKKLGSGSRPFLEESLRAVISKTGATAPAK